MTPTWQSDCGTVSLYCADCLDVLPGLEGVDAVVTDPPYNVGIQYAGYDDNRKRESYREWCCEWMFGLRNACSGPIAVSVGIANLTLWERIRKPDWWMAWHKPAAMGRCYVGFNNWEPIALFGKPAKQTTDVIRACIVPSDDLEGHPCPKPVEWAIKQVDILTTDEQTVLDNFMGSGTTGVACVQLGRSFIGIEKEPRYFDIAKRRITEALNSQPLFKDQITERQEPLDFANAQGALR